MGEAKRRGTPEERKAAAAPRVKPDHPGYRRMIPYRNSALDRLWGQFKMRDDMTVNEMVTKARADQAASAARRETDRLSTADYKAALEAGNDKGQEG